MGVQAPAPFSVGVGLHESRGVGVMTRGGRQKTALGKHDFKVSRPDLGVVTSPSWVHVSIKWR